MAARKDKGAAGGMAFEEAMEKLEAIVEEMESDQVPLEKLINGYEEGTKLLKLCQSRIAEAQKRIEIIARDAGAEELTLSEFDPKDAGEAGVAEKEEETDEVRLL